jgi:hypothetical protein
VGKCGVKFKSGQDHLWTFGSTVLIRFFNSSFTARKMRVPKFIQELLDGKAERKKTLGDMIKFDKSGSSHTVSFRNQISILEKASHVVSKHAI